MNKEEFVALLAKRHRRLFSSKAAALRGLDAVLDTLTAGLKREGRKGVQFVNFGSFEVRAMRRRRGAHPQTGEKIIIPARKTVKFRPGKALLEAVDRRRRMQKPPLVSRQQDK